MPELPEVEAYARYFSRHGVGRRIAGVDVLDERVLATRPDVLRRRLRGRTFQGVRRHGKRMFVDAGDVWLHLHFGMSGDLTAFRAGDPVPRFARVVFRFEDGSRLAFEDMRLFGVVEVIPSADVWIAEHGLGPDPLDSSFTLRRFRQLLATRRGAIKSLLMTQEILAGVGNLYADEALFQASIHPRRTVDRLTVQEVNELYRRLRSVLRTAVARRTSDREVPHRWLFHHREEGERCPMCGGTVRRTVVFGRTTYFCASHQR